MSGPSLVRLPPPDPTERAAISITTYEHEVTAATLAAVSKHPEMYQRGGMLVQSVRDARATGNLSRPEGANYIAALGPARLREMIAERCALVKRDKKGEFVSSHVPDWLVKQVEGRKQWQEIRPLEALTETPILRADGSVVSVPGYDPTTGVLYNPSRKFPRIADQPTLAQAKAAIAALLEPFADFPFAAPHHRSAVLAGILTPLARFAFAGPSPLILITKNVRGAGGSLLADAISIAATGRGMARMTQAGDEDEERKRILSIALAGDRMVLVDNVDHPLGGAALDAALTGTEWRDRILGRSEMVTAPLLATWFATGNNPQILGDTVRRVLPIRIESPDEKPEERTGFKHSPLEAYIQEQHPRLVAAALTVLRAHAFAGSPVPSGLKSWGSFDSWSDRVRGAIVWAGEVDPAIGREELANGSDDEGNALGMILDHWRHLDSTGTGVSSQHIVRALTEAEGDLVQGLRDAIILLAGKGDIMPTPARLGKKLAHFVGRVVGEKKLTCEDGREGVKLWRVRQTKPSP